MLRSHEVIFNFNMHFVSFRYDFNNKLNFLFSRYNNLKIIFHVTYAVQRSSIFSFHQCEFWRIFMMYFCLNTNPLIKVGFTSKFWEKYQRGSRFLLLWRHFSQNYDIQLLPTDSYSARKNTSKMIIHSYGEKVKFCQIVYRIRHQNPNNFNLNFLLYVPPPILLLSPKKSDASNKQSYSQNGRYWNQMRSIIEEPRSSKASRWVLINSVLWISEINHL